MVLESMEMVWEPRRWALSATVALGWILHVGLTRGTTVDDCLVEGGSGLVVIVGALFGFVVVVGGGVGGVGESRRWRGST